MTTKIHPTSIIHPKAQIDEGVEIGPFCVIGEEVKIGKGSKLHSHVVIDGRTNIGQENEIFPFASLGLVPQDLKFKGEKSELEIGDKNRIREHTTIHLGTEKGGMLTKIGNNCLFMVGVHVAHDCHLGDNLVLANNATLAGHVVVENEVVIGGLSAIHQFVRIGRGAMIGGMSGVESDVIPYGVVKGERAHLAGLNLTGMKRHGISNEEIRNLMQLYDKIFDDNAEEFKTRAAKLATQFTQYRAQEVINFINSPSARSFCKPEKLAK